MDRITYSRDFQVRCMAQYLRGNGPTSIFASAGLNPKIVGSKLLFKGIFTVSLLYRTADGGAAPESEKEE